MSSLMPLLKKDSHYNINKEPYEMEVLSYKKNLVNSLPRSGNSLNVTPAGNGSKHSSIISLSPSSSPRLNKNDRRHSKRLSRLSQQISMQTKYLNPGKPKVKRWKLYEGKSRVYLHGRIVTGNDNVFFLFSTLLIIAPCVLYMVFVLPIFNTTYYYIIFAYLTTFCTASLIKTSWTDPGILPRYLEPSNDILLNTSSVEYPESTYKNSSTDRFEIDDTSAYSSSSHLNQTQTITSTYPFASPIKPYIPPTRNIVINGRVVSQKFCDTCKIYRPPRSFHCSYCDNCVENCDHHCPWTANCIGKRNYRYFYAFICSSTLLCFIVLVGCCSFIIKKMKEHHFEYSIDGAVQCMLKYPVPFILFSIIIIIGWFNTFMSVYHTYLICRNITTHEQIKEQYIPDTNRSYFSTGNIFKNILLVLFRPVAPARYAMRQYVTIPSNNNDSNNSSSIINPFLLDPPASSSNSNDVNLSICD